jgi:ATP-dependent Clp protease ATP-binding subunit ClpB
MNFNNFTIKSQEAVQKAQEIAQGHQQQAIETSHILKGMLMVDENIVPWLLKKLDVNVPAVIQSLERIILSYPKVTGGDQYLSNNASKALQKAGPYPKEFGDEFISLEHLLLGILAGVDDTAKLLKDAGVIEKDLKQAIVELRKGSTVKSPISPTASFPIRPLTLSTKPLPNCALKSIHCLKNSMKPNGGSGNWKSKEKPSNAKMTRKNYRH